MGGFPSQRASNTAENVFICWGHHSYFNDLYKIGPVYNMCQSLGPSGAWYKLSWWRHQMETFSALLAICAGIHRSPVNSPHKGQWRGALMFSLICVWINDRVNNREAGDLRRYRAHYDVTLMMSLVLYIMRVTCEVKSHYLNQCCLIIIDWAFRNEPHQNLNKIQLLSFNKLHLKSSSAK